MKPKIEYVTGLQPGENQYLVGTSNPISPSNKRVDARYVQNPNAHGNIFIEALPPVPQVSQLMSYYHIPIVVPSKEELEEWDQTYRTDNIDDQLNHVRVVLPFHTLLESQFRSIIYSSYRNRQLIINEDYSQDVVIKNKKVTSSALTEIIEEANVTPGFRLIGTSGCGKTTGINILLSHYPQVIYHHIDEYTVITQLLYIVVQCTPNSNFHQLYENIGRAIDKALGNRGKFYQTEFSRKKSLKDKYSLLHDLIEHLAIGCIIFDEIELMDLKSFKETSMETFLSLTNMTGVAIAVVGTTDALEKMFTKTRLVRRLGIEIEASKYCSDPQLFKQICYPITQYQWSSEPIKYTDELVDALYNASHGVISDLIGIYKMIQKDQVRTIPYKYGNKRTSKVRQVTPEYIADMSGKYFSLLDSSRRNEEQVDSSDYLEDVAKRLADQLSAEERKTLAKSEEDFQNITEQSSDSNMFLTLSEVAGIIQNDFPGQYGSEEISREFFSLYQDSMPAQELSVKIIANLKDSKKLQKKKKKAVPKKDPVTIEDLQKFLFND
ncbi:MAG: ATP-binding protein [Allobaculum sp.]